MEMIIQALFSYVVRHFTLYRFLYVNARQSKSELLHRWINIVWVLTQMSAYFILAEIMPVTVWPTRYFPTMGRDFAVGHHLLCCHNDAVHIPNDILFTLNGL